MHSKYLTHSAQLVQINMVLFPLNKIFIFLVVEYYWSKPTTYDFLYFIIEN